MMIIIIMIIIHFYFENLLNNNIIIKAQFDHIDTLSKTEDDTNIIKIKYHF